MKSEIKESLENARILQSRLAKAVFLSDSIMGKAKKLKVSKQNTVTTGGFCNNIQ